MGIMFGGLIVCKKLATRTRYFSPLLRSIMSIITLQMKMADKGEPGINNDTYSVYVYRTNGSMIYSSNWTGTTTVQVPVSGGNIQVSGVAVGAVATKAAHTDISETPEVGGAPDTSAAKLLKHVDKLQRGIKAFEVKAWPTPATSHFNVIVASPVNETVELRMYDMQGRLVEFKRGVTNDIFRLGNGVPAGMYIIEARQGGVADKKTIKVIKAN